MHLYLTNRSHLNTTYVDDSGQVMYKVSTPNKFFKRVATIKRVLPGGLRSSSEATQASNNRRSSDEATNDNNPVNMEYANDEEPDDIQGAEGGNDERRFDGFGHLAEITFKAIAPSILRFGGQEHESNKFFTKKAFGWYGSNRAFTGPDGIEYQWIMGHVVSRLVRVDSDGNAILIARYYRPRHIIRRSVEILPEGMHMVDLILVTFVYIQKIRNDKERM